MMMANNTSRTSSGCDHSVHLSVNVAISYLYFFLFPIALLLNSVATWVSLHLRSTSTFIVYLKNLVAADLLVTLTLPMMAAGMLPGAAVELMAFNCRYSTVIFYTSMYTSISLMGLIGLDRFFKVVRPCGKLLGQSVTFSRVMSALVWVILFGGTTFPTIALTQDSPGNATGDFCMTLKSPAGVTLHIFVVLFMEILFWFVSVLIVLCYIYITLKVLQSFKNSGSNNNKGKKKTKLRVFLILLVYFVCFMPLHLVRIPFSIYEVHTKDDCPNQWTLIVEGTALWISATNTCLDPLLYIFLCREFRDKLVDMIKATGMCVGLFHSEK